MRSIALVGGEPVGFHVDARGEVDYLEVRPGRMELLLSARHLILIGPTTIHRRSAIAPVRSVRASDRSDLQVVARGSSRGQSIVRHGTDATKHVRGGRIRSALGLRETALHIAGATTETGVSLYSIHRPWLGHGSDVQVGAYGLAKLGWNADKILKNYYTASS